MSFFNYVNSRKNYDPPLRKTIEDTVTNILDKETDETNPAMLLGKIQSGKTNAFIGIIAMAFDRGYDIAIVLTKNSRALVEQTIKRLNSEFEEPVGASRLYIYDILKLPTELSGFIRSKKLILIVKKEDSNLKRLVSLVTDRYPELCNKNVLIVDDEADQASVTYYTDSANPKEGISFGKVAAQVSKIRKQLKSRSDFLQVTATPYALFLQPEKIEINSVGYAPLKPNVTMVLEPHNSYIGGDYYFEKSQNVETPAADLYIEVNDDEFARLKQPNARYIDTILRTNNLYTFRFAVLTYLVGGTIRILQEEAIENPQEWAPLYRSSFMVHVDSSRGGHRWQGELVRQLISRLKSFCQEHKDEFDTLIQISYDNLQLSLQKTAFFRPELAAVLVRLTQALLDDEISVKEVNSENEVINLLDNKGQLRLDNPFNIFIGGQVLDRGITVDNLIGFFYGRNPQRFQTDTVLQHSRMYGARSQPDLAVTRFYTSPRIYAAMQSMHFFDEALRAAIKSNGEHARVRFIQSGNNGLVSPCGPAKIRLSEIKTIQAHVMEKPVGIQTRAKSYISRTIEKLDLELNVVSKSNSESPFLIPINQAIEYIDLIASTFEFSDREHYKNENWEWNVKGFKESLSYASGFCDDADLKEKVYVLLRKGRNQSRMKDNNLAFNDAPYDGKTDVPTARQFAKKIPVLMLLRQEGRQEDGWLGTPFYWPVLVYPQSVPVSIYSE
jgi:hypothetical protein